MNKFNIELIIQNLATNNNCIDHFYYHYKEFLIKKRLINYNRFGIFLKIIK